MPIVWYLCPYDVTAPLGRVTRTPAISRYIPTFPDPQGSVWDEAEILGNHCVVKVDAPLAVHTTIQADPDFFVLPTTIPANRRNVISTKLQALGYTSAEVTRANWDVAALLDLLTTASTLFQRNAAGDGIDVLPGRRAPHKTVAQINARLPG